MTGHVSGAPHGARPHGEHATHVVPIRTYILVFLALMLGTWLTVEAAGHDFGTMNAVVALTIAVTKATLVVLFFMHVKYSSRLTKLVVVSAVVFLAILIVGTLHDYYSPYLSTAQRPPSLTRQ